MEYEEHNVFISLVLLGFLIGMCIGAVLAMILDRKEVPKLNLTSIHRNIHIQRDSLQNLRKEFTDFRANHERELMQLLRETLRASPRSTISEEPTL